MLEAGLRDSASFQLQSQRSASKLEEWSRLDSPPPRRFGDYEIIEEIARGGMGVVYLGRQRSLDRFVALKFLLPDLMTSTGYIERFKREARAAAGLRHSNIVTVHEVSEVEGRHFFSMDFIEGRDLADILRDGPLTPARAARYCQIIASAIEFAHSRWVLHRDLKPSNVLIDLNDQPQVTDFGLAGKMEIRTDLTLTSQVIGSPSYLSPEQAAGRVDDVNAATDVYAIGAILYECLTGHNPFQAQTLQETLLRICEQEPPPLRVVNSAVPRDLETICLKCLEKDPVHRYPSARDLAADLGRWLRHEPIRARTATLTGRSVRWVRRNPTLAGIGFGLCAVIFAIFALLLRDNLRLRDLYGRLAVQVQEGQEHIILPHETNKSDNAVEAVSATAATETENHKPGLQDEANGNSEASAPSQSAQSTAPEN